MVTPTSSGGDRYFSARSTPGRATHREGCLRDHDSDSIARYQSGFRVSKNATDSPVRCSGAVRCGALRSPTRDRHAGRDAYDPAGTKPSTEYGAQNRPIAELPTDISRARIGRYPPYSALLFPRERPTSKRGSDAQSRGGSVSQSRLIGELTVISVGEQWPRRQRVYREHVREVAADSHYIRHQSHNHYRSSYRRIHHQQR
jgi:hypothetical protein